jgi:hypothetical protein
MELINNDINDEIVKHLSFISLIQLSKVSKDYKKIVNNLSNSYKINKLFHDSYSINNFCFKIIKYECKKFNYKKIKQNTRYQIIKFVANSELTHYIKSNCFIILYNFIILIIHSLKKNYKKIINIIENIDYTNILFQYEKNFADIIKLNTTFVNNYFTESISSNGKIIKLIKITCFIHTLILSSANITKHKEFISVSKTKKQELKENLDNIYLNKEYPKYFIKNMLKILNRVSV